MTRAATTNVRAGDAGNTVLGFCARWAGHGLMLALTHPMNALVALVLTTGIAYGATNAMFLQTARHPAPLFMATASIAQPVETAPAPAARPPGRVSTPALAPPSLELPADAQAAIGAEATDKIGNKDVAALQTRLTELGFFSGKIDGYYGPRTADAIRQFENAAGLTPVGAVSAEIVAAAKAFEVAPAPVPTPTTRDLANPTVQVPLLSSVAETESQVIEPVDDPIGRLVAEVASVAPVATTPVSEPEPRTHLPPSVDPELVRMVQTGLSRLGFLHAEVSGTFNAETARAIREFENYNNYRVTGELKSDLVDVLMANGAFD